MRKLSGLFFFIASATFMVIMTVAGVNYILDLGLDLPKQYLISAIFGFLVITAPGYYRWLVGPEVPKNVNP